MSKIFEALQMADRQRQDDSSRPMDIEIASASYAAMPMTEQSPAPVVQKLVQAMEPAPFPVHLEQTMTALYNSIATLLPTTKGRSIEFIAPHRGAGNSTLVREFAKVVAVNLKKSVLLLDADHHSPTQAKSFQIEQASGWDAVIDRRERIETVLRPVGDSRLTISQLLVKESAQPLLFESAQFRSMLNRLKESFDLILIDAPPAADYSDGLVLASKVDGVVLVTAAEETRWQVVQDVTRRMQMMGVNLLGTILNKKRYHIPQAVYDRI